MRIFIFCWLTLSLLTRAEIVLFKYDTNAKKLKGLDFGDKKDRSIYDNVILRYNWPSSQMYFNDKGFEQEEYLEAIGNDNLKKFMENALKKFMENAPEKFMESNIQDNRYALVDVPDTLLSVAAIVTFYENGINQSLD